MVQKLDRLGLTPSQTAGPYVHIGLAPEACGIEKPPFPTLGTEIAGPAAKGTRITVRGRVVDGGDLPLRDCLIETWQADAAGIYPGQQGADPAVTGFGRFPADFTSGEFSFETVRPGAVDLPGDQAIPPHISFWIFARGINHGLHTRMYFPEDNLSGDPLLARIEHRDRIATLVAEARGETEYWFEIRLQGAGETVFFDI
ncbi:protocatechuate 3,4-dioxygenase subunit alpha [Thioclava atlantica]|uniref:Protocatechuate 3,4-dioxygenase subunit alpha n=1 Tax=Thioclava atlantica TaxID=1317124 RepID=A0A085TT66_9RHOB|nr:protocatechuate 3,4-dioxygenase subunit alpha [Thioclava atlantica]KFE33913.1 protocatechuate 3,4-dioxygenase subunit alpha [Thioclava atlantica]